MADTAATQQKLAALTRVMCSRDEPLFRIAVAEDLMTRLGAEEPSVAQLCAALLAALGNEDASELGRSAQKRFGLYSGTPLHASVSEARDVDVLLLTVKPRELEACLSAFDVPAGTPPVALGSTGVCGWPLEREGRTWMICMVGTAGNVQTAVLVGVLSKVLKPKLAVLVGMAAGVPDLQLGDVVVAEEVLEYEFQRMTSSSMVLQPRPYTPNATLVQNVPLLKSTRPQWSRRCRRLGEVAELRGQELKLAPKDYEDWYPEVVIGVILAGNKLLENGSLPKLKKMYHDRVRAAEMEGAGFAAACQSEGWPWLVFRGVADYGQADRVKEWQFPATFAAAECVRNAVAAPALFEVMLGEK